MIRAVDGVIRRRVLVNYRVDPAVMRPLVPDQFELMLVDGWAVAGMCLIRQEALRPSWIPAERGLSTESAAYRVAVDGPNGSAVYVARRDTGSNLQAAAAGRLFPGACGRSMFAVIDDGTMLDLEVTSADGQGDLRLAARAATALPNASIFPDLRLAARFFQGGAVGWSRRRKSSDLEGIELRLRDWTVLPLAVDEIVSSYYDEPRRFPPGSIAFDSALVMRHVRHEWRSVRPV